MKSFFSAFSLGYGYDGAWMAYKGFFGRDIYTQFGVLLKMEAREVRRSCEMRLSAGGRGIYRWMIHSRFSFFLYIRTHVSR